MSDYLSPLIKVAIKLIKESDLTIYTQTNYEKCFSNIRRNYPFSDKPLSRERIDSYFKHRYGIHTSSVCLNGTQRIIRRAFNILLQIQNNEELIFHARGKTFIFDPSRIILPLFNEFLDLIEKDTCCERFLTKKRELSRFNNFLQENLIDPCSVNIQQIESYIASKQIPKSQLETAVYIIRQYYRYLFTENIIKKDIAHSFPKVPRYKQKLHSKFTPQEIKTLLNSVDLSSDIGKRDYLILLLLSCFGLRSGDISNLKFKNFDLENKLLTIKTSKTGKTVSLPIPNRVLNALKNYLVHVRSKDTSGEFVLVSLGLKTYFQPLSSDSIRNIVIKYCRHSNLKTNENHIGGHAFRRSAATILAKNKVSLPVIKDILAHASEKMSGHYIVNTVDELRLCILPMPALKSEIYYAI